MVSYDDFDQLVGKLKRKSIDAYMVGEGFAMDDWKRQYYDGRYVWLGYLDRWVDYPDEDTGEGGGTGRYVKTEWDKGELSSEDNFVAEFDAIRGVIDTIVDPWRNLPDPGVIGQVLSRYDNLRINLSSGVSQADGDIYPGGAIGESIDLIKLGLDKMTGNVAASFKTAFSGQIGRVVGGQYVIALLCASQVAAQQGLWEAARKDVADTLNRARYAMQRISEKSSSEWLTALSVAGWAAQGATLIPGLGTLAGAASLGLQIIDESVPKQSEELSTPQDYDSGIRTLRDNFEALHLQILQEEEAIEENLTQNESRIRSNRSSFDITEVPITTDGISGISIDHEGAIRDVVDKYMPDIAETLKAVASDPLDCGTFTAVGRDETIGIGRCGPSNALGQMNWLLYELIQNTAWETEKSASNLRMAVDLIVKYDQQLADDLNRAAGDLQGGSPWDPWDEPGGAAPVPSPRSPGRSTPI